jgi:hypothetical protein
MMIAVYSQTATSPQVRAKMRNQLDALLDHVTDHAAAVEPRTQMPSWSTREDQFITEHLGWLTDAAMGVALGRTEIAVHLRWYRDLGLPGPSKAPDVITANKAAEALGIDGHKVAHWVDAGLIPGRVMAGGRYIRLIQRRVFYRWACAPNNWVYFNPSKVIEPHLKRLIELEQKRWGDEWWSTRQVADFHGADTGDVKRYIQLGRIRSFRLPVSLGGRDHNRKWSNHFVLKSEAVQVKFLRRGDDMSTLTPRGKAWLKKAIGMGMTATEIGRTMKRDGMTVLNWVRRYFPKMKLADGRGKGRR